MPVTTTAGVPCRIIAGNTAIFTISDRNHPASLWFLDFVLSRNGIRLSTIRATASGDDYSVTIPAASAAQLTPGRAQYTEVFTEQTGSPPQRDTGCSGWLTITPDPAGNLVPTDNQVALANCIAAIQKITTRTHQSVSFNGQTFSTSNLQLLLSTRDRLQALVNNELREMGVSLKGGAKLVRFRF